MVQETTTADPTNKLGHSVFILEKLFPKPLTWTHAGGLGESLAAQRCLSVSQESPTHAFS
jgi:hypothetical protein